MGLLRHAGQVPRRETHRWQFVQTKHRRGVPVFESGLLHLQGEHAGRELGLPVSDRHLPDQQAAAKLGLRSRASLSVFGRVMFLQREQLELPRRLKR